MSVPPAIDVSPAPARPAGRAGVRRALADLRVAHGAWAPALALLAGLYLPTAWGGLIRTPLGFLQAAVLLALLLPLLLRPDVQLRRLHVALALIVQVSVWGGTVFSDLPEFAFGGYLPYLLFSLLLVTPLARLRASKWMPRLFLLVNLVNLALGLGVVFDVAAVKGWLVDFYSVANPDLVESMMARGRPVLTFGTHSIAAFYLFVFFYLSLKTYLARRSGVFFVVALFYLWLLPNLSSVSALFFFGLALAYLAWRTPSLFAGSLVALAFAFGLGALLGVRIELFDELRQLANALSSDTNGFLGRFAESGALTGTLEYIATHPLSPVGLRYSPDLTFTDSGFVLHTLRGSAVLPLAFYGGLIAFLWHNLVSRRTALGLALVFLVFEVGYPNLTYLRTLLLLPFVVIYLNTLADPPPRPRPRTASS